MAIDTMVESVHYQEVDSGLRWVKDAAIAIDSDGPLDSDRALTPNVLKVEGGYRLYYHGLGPQRPNPASKGATSSARSPATPSAGRKSPESGWMPAARGQPISSGARM